MQPAPLSTRVTEDISLVFTTPMLVRWVPDHESLNAELAAQVLAERERNPGVSTSNYGGWHSKNELWEWPGEGMNRLRRAIHDAVLRMSAVATMEENLSNVDVRYRARGWANINRDGAYNSVHAHGDVQWACVYYVQMGEEEPGHEPNGRLVLYDPRSVISGKNLRPGFGFGSRLMIDPEPGKLVMFPGWVSHWVTPYRGSGERISLAVNIEVTGGRNAGLEL